MTDAYKISMVLPDFGGGGAERVMVFYANAFVERGIEITFIVGRAEGPCLVDLRSEVRLIDLKVSRMIRALPALVRHLNADTPDAVLSALTHANLVTLLAARLVRKCPRIVVAERNSVKMLRQGRWPKRLLKQALVRALYPFADRITFVSEAMQAEFSEFLSQPPDRLVTIYNPVQVDVLRYRGAARPEHPWLVEKNSPVVVAAGRLSPQKDFVTLLRGFAILSKHSSAKLIIYGEGPDRAALEALRADLNLADSVALPGFASNLPAEIGASDLFVLSSRWEGLPGVLLEALAMQKPVVASDCPTGPDEILEGGRWGMLVPVGDPDKLAEAMLQTLQCPLVVLHPEVLARFEPQRIVDQYLSVLLPARKAKETPPDA